MERICGNCKYKGEVLTTYDEEEYKDVPNSYFRCNRIVHDQGWKFKQGLKALVIDGSGYYAALCVEDDFGCIEWKPKET